MKKKLSPIESRIVSVLVKKDDYMTTTEVSKEAKISWNTAMIHLKKFYSLGWVEKYESGSTVYWRAVY